MTKSKTKKQGKKFRKIDLSDLNSSASIGETNTEETGRRKNNDEVRRVNPSLHDEGTPHSEDPVLTMVEVAPSDPVVEVASSDPVVEVASSDPVVEVASSDPVENLLQEVSNCHVHENVSHATEANYSQNECSSSNTEKNVTRQGKHKKNRNKNRNNSQTSQEESKLVERYSTDPSESRKILPALSNGVGVWKQETAEQIKPDSSQLQSSVKREMNPNAREFKPKKAEHSNVTKEEMGRGSEMVHSEQDKRDGNHNYSHQKRGSEKSEVRSMQYTNKNRYESSNYQGSNSRRDHDRSRSYQNTHFNRRSPDGHYSSVRGGHEGSRYHRSRERDHQEKRKDSYGRKSSFGNDEYKNRAQANSNRQPDWDEVKQDDQQQSYNKGNENSRDGRTCDQGRTENSIGRRNSSSAKVEIKTMAPRSFEPQQNDENWDDDFQQKQSDENWDDDFQQEQSDENWDDEVQQPPSNENRYNEVQQQPFPGEHDKNRDATTYGTEALEDRDQVEGISDSGDRNEGHKGHRGFRNQESGQKRRKRSLERQRQQNNKLVPDSRSVKNEQSDVMKRFFSKKKNLPDPRMDRENKSKQCEGDGNREKDEDTQRESSTSSERTEREDTKGDTDLDSQDDQESRKTYYDSWNDKKSKDHRRSFPESKPTKPNDRMSAGGDISAGRIEKFQKDYYYDRSFEKTDAEYKEFNDKFRWNVDHQYIKVTEKEQDLFGMPKEYSLGHCVAEDMRMGSGIAVNFKRDFKNIDDLLGQKQKQGGLAVLEHEGRYIYYLVTKKVSTGKPTYETFWSSLKKMREHMVENEVKKLAIPRIGCGLDRLEWDKVKYMIEFLFKNVDVEIVVCNFQQMDDTPQKDNLSTRLVYHPEPLKNIDAFTIILYFSTEDGHITNKMEDLDKKFNFLRSFRQSSSKKLGTPIRNEIKNYILYGCIVRRTIKDPFDFKSFAKCLSEISKNNRKDQYEYVALEPVHDDTDDILNEKVITLLRNLLRKVDIYICSGEAFEEQKSSPYKSSR